MDTYPGDPVLHAAAAPAGERAAVRGVAVLQGGPVPDPGTVPVRSYPDARTCAVYAAGVKARLAGRRMTHPTGVAPGAQCAYCHWAPPRDHPPLFLMHDVTDDGTLVSDGTMLCRPSCYHRYLLECVPVDTCVRQYLLQIMREYMAAAGLHGGVPLGRPRRELAVTNALDGRGLSHAAWHAAADAQLAAALAGSGARQGPPPAGDGADADADANADAEESGAPPPAPPLEAGLVWRALEGVPWTVAAALIEEFPAGVSPGAREAAERVRANAGALGDAGDAAEGPTFSIVNLTRPPEDAIARRIAGLPAVDHVPSEFEGFVEAQEARAVRAAEARAARAAATAAAAAAAATGEDGDAVLPTRGKGRGKGTARDAAGGEDGADAPAVAPTALTRMVGKRRRRGAK